MPYPKKIPIPAEAYHLLKASTFHLGRVKDLKDPDGRGRVRLEVTSLLGDGKEHWSGWVEPMAHHIGSSRREGDCGIWWQPVVDQFVLVGFLNGDYDAPFYIPGPAWQKELTQISPLIPKEVKNVILADLRQGTRVRVFKTEAGHTLLMDDNGKMEKLALVDWTGSGLYLVAPGKEEDEKEQPGSGSKFRKNQETRETRLVALGTSKKPSEILSGNTHYLSLLDLNGQGLSCIAKDDEGMVSIKAAKNNGEVGPSIVLDAKNNRIFLTAGNTQLQILGDMGKIMVTRQIIQESVKTDVETGIKQVVQTTGDAFKGLVDA